MGFRLGFFRMTKNKVDKKGILEIEALLDHYLRPVDPRPEFVSQLQQRLFDSARPVVRINGKKYLEYGFIAVASLIGSALVIMTGVRAVLTVMSALGILHFVKSRSDDKQMSSPEAAV